MRKVSLKSLAFVGVLGVLAAAASDAFPIEHHTMYISFSKAVALPGVELSAGTYMFELAAPVSDSSLVRVRSRDGRKVFLTAFTFRIDRPANLKPGQVVLLGEAARGTAPPVTAWFPDDEPYGRQFIYR